MTAMSYYTLYIYSILIRYLNKYSSKEIVYIYFERLKINRCRFYVIKILKILLTIVDRYILNLICILSYKNC